MWMLIRSLLTLAFAVFHLIRRNWRTKAVPARIIDGTPVGQRLHTNKRGGVTGATLSLPLKTGLRFRLEPKTAFDRLLLWLGLTTEQQTDDAAFDDAVFIECDQFVLGSWLRDDEPSRHRILRLFRDAEVRTIRTHRDELQVTLPCTKAPDASVMREAVELARTLRRLTADRTFRPDHFLRWALAVELVVWGLAGQALGAYLQGHAEGSDRYLASAALWHGSVVAGLVLVLSGLGLFRLILGRSSRGRTILVESFFVLLVALPVLAQRLVMDLNESHPVQRPVVIQSKITGKSSEMVQSGRSRKTLRYLHLAPPQVAYGQAAPGRIRMDRDRWEQAVPGQRAKLTIQPGLLRLPYVERFTLLEAPVETTP